MRGHVLLTLAAALIVLTPAAAAGDCISDAVLTFGVGTTRFDVEQVFDGNDAQDLREAVDTGAGNDDGRLTSMEIARWEAAMSQSARISIRHCLPVGFFGPEDGGVGAGQDGTLPSEREDFVATFHEHDESGLTGPVTLRFSGLLRSPVEGDAVEVVVVPEALEGLSELIECLAPDAVETNYAQNPCGDQSRDPLDRMDRLVLRPQEGHRLVPESIQPTPARDAFDGTAIVLTGLVVEDSPFTLIRFDVQHDVRDEAEPGAWTLVAGGAAAVGLVAVWRVERLQYRAWWLAAVAGFTRIRRERVLDHERRRLILEAITTEPGIHLGALRRELELGTGALVHHLRILQREGVVEARRRGNRVQFVPVGHRGPVLRIPGPLQQRLLDIVQETPGLSQTELAQRLEQPRNTVAYHINQLVGEGRLQRRREGRVVRHYPAPGVGPRS